MAAAVAELDRRLGATTMDGIGEPREPRQKTVVINAELAAAVVSAVTQPPSSAVRVVIGGITMRFLISTPQSIHAPSGSRVDTAITSLTRAGNEMVSAA